MENVHLPFKTRNHQCPRHVAIFWAKKAKFGHCPVLTDACLQSGQIVGFKPKMFAFKILFKTRKTSATLYIDASG